MLNKMRSFSRAVLGRSAFEHDMEDEMRFHVEARAGDLVRRGLRPDEATRQARLEFGNAALHRDRCRDSRSLNPLGRSPDRSALRRAQHAEGINQRLDELERALVPKR